MARAFFISQFILAYFNKNIEHFLQNILGQASNILVEVIQTKAFFA